MNQPISRLRRRLTDGLSFHVRSLKRRAGGREPIHFCLNSGRCGSASLVRLLQANGVRGCYHELLPDLHRPGIDYYEQRLSPEQVAEEIYRTRAGVFFEANNRLFSLTGPIRLAFPEARFVFLHRDGRDVVRSGLQRHWYKEGDRFDRIRLGAAAVGSSFAKACRYWAEVNQRIISDMRVFQCPYIALRFEDLVQGRGLEPLEDFLDVRLSRCAQLPAANRTENWSVPAYENWCEPWRLEFDNICGPVMQQLGYETTHEIDRTGGNVHRMQPGQPAASHSP